MNQEVFGSSFAISKMNRSAKQAVDSELIVPVSATDMSYDEMEYVDGGGRFQQLLARLVAQLVALPQVWSPDLL